MSEDTHVENQEVETEDQEVQLSTVEQEALKYGWKPKEEFEGDEGQWRSAETFMALKPFFERIDSQNKKLKQYERAQHEIIKEVANMRKTEYDRAVRTLQAERKAAFEDGDLDRYHRLEDEIDDLKDQRRNIEAQAAPTQETPDQTEFLDWKTANTWYDRDEDLRDWADARGVRLAQSGMPVDEVLALVSAEVREKFPERFTNPNRTKASAVAASEGNPRTSAKGVETLSPEEKRIMHTFVRQGIMTEAEYMKEYKKVKGA